MIPLLLQPALCRCLVVGGGPVGQRRATLLLEGGAAVRLVCLEPSRELPAPHLLEWLQEPYTTRHLEGMTLVVAAAPAAVNVQVAADARARGVWVNRADAPEQSDFHFPAVHRQGPLLLTASTSGTSPALAKRIRQGWATQFDVTYGQWLEILADLRALVKQLPAEAQDRAWQFLTADHWGHRLRERGLTQVRQEMIQGMGLPGTFPPQHVQG